MLRKTVYVALALIIGFALIGCKDEGIIPSLPGTKKASNLQNFEGSFVSSRSEAISLFNETTRVISALTDIDKKLFGTAFKDKYEGKDIDAFIASKYGEKSASWSVSINDSEEIIKASGVNAGKISGSSSASMSSNMTFYEWYVKALANIFEKGDKSSESSKAKRTFEITDGFLTYTYNPFGYSPTTYKISGYITAEGSSKESETLKEKASGNDDEDKWEYSSSSEQDISLAITFSNGTKGAKFLFSAASNRSYVNRTVSSESGNIYSDIQVYDNEDNLKYTIPYTSASSTVSSWLSFSEKFYY